MKIDGELGKSTKKEDVFPGNGKMPGVETRIQQLEREILQTMQE